MDAQGAAAFRAAWVAIRPWIQYFIVGREMTETEKWKELCAKAAVEQDPKRLLALVTELNRMLEERRKPNERQRDGKTK